jgi:hypothetical protein
MRKMRLTNEELAAIRERAEKATPGPWFKESDEYGNINVYFAWDAPNGGNEVVERIDSEDDADFIANARTDIPKLLAHIEALEVENERMKDALIRIDELVDEFFNVENIDGKPTYVLKDGLEKYSDIIYEIVAVNFNGQPE